MTAQRSARSGGTGRRRRNVVLPGLSAAAVALVATFQPWATGVVDDAVLGRAQVSALGSSVAGLAATALIAGIAGLLAATIAGRVARTASGVAVIAAGCVSALAAAGVLRDPAAALTAATGATVGRTGEAPVNGATTVWPWLTVVGSVGLALAGLAVVVAGAAWSVRAGRYEAPGGAGRTVPEGEEDDWDRLSRGEDPTVSDPVDRPREA